ncbi:uncharacterized protein [Heterodontus francisci]|uniref:uncharacterized protein isoform X1 n=1 Tax=Heterodontus francisci TaxID=7792 RepID=UPI00355C593F
MPALVNALVQGLQPDLRKMFTLTCVGWEGKQNLTEVVSALQHCERQLQCQKSKPGDKGAGMILYASSSGPGRRQPRWGRDGGCDRNEQVYRGGYSGCCGTEGDYYRRMPPVPARRFGPRKGFSQETLPGTSLGRPLPSTADHAHGRESRGATFVDPCLTRKVSTDCGWRRGRRNFDYIVRMWTVILTLFCVTFIRAWTDNSAVQRMQAVASQGNRTECWICTHFPTRPSSSEMHFLALPSASTWSQGNTGALISRAPTWRRQPTPVAIRGPAWLCVRR